MDDSEYEKLSDIACRLSSMTFVLHGCCMYYEGLEVDTGKLVDFAEILYETSRELFDFKFKIVQACEPDTSSDFMPMG